MKDGNVTSGAGPRAVGAERGQWTRAGPALSSLLRGTRDRGAGVAHYH